MNKFEKNQVKKGIWLQVILILILTAVITYATYFSS